MKVYLRQLKDLTWTDITQYVKLPISINDTVDETFDTCKIVAIFHTAFPLFDVKKPFSPKQYIKITTADNPLNETEENTYWFLSDKCKNARIRKESNNYKALYKHEINGIELLYRTTDYNLPNYAITQPKTEYFDVYSRFAMKQVSLNQLFQQDGTSININSGTEIGYNEVNNDDDNIQFGYESNKHYIRLNDTDEVAYNINVLLQYAKTANTYYMEFGLINRHITAFETGETTLTSKSKIIIRISTVRYDASNNILETENIDETVEYSGGQVSESDYQITSFPTSSSVQLNCNVVKKEKVGSTDVAYTKVFFSIQENTELRNLSSTLANPNYFMPTNIAGTSNNTYVKVKLDSLQFNVQSSVLNEAVDITKKTLLQFVEKALFDYNLNKRDKITLGDNVQTLLDIEAKESEWAGYDFKELIYRACKYVGGTPYLSFDRVLTILQPTKQSIEFDLNEGQEVEQDMSADEFIDSSVSNVKNLVSQDDFVTERILIGSINPEFSQFTDDESAGFVLSNDIYYVKSAKLYTPTLTFNIDSEDIDSNITGQSHVWDISTRLFEEDIYNALPDARFDFTPEERINNLSQGNTIKYKSGTNIVSRITHQAPRIPEFQPFGNVTTPAEYAIIEMLISLAYETLPTPTENILPSLDFNAIKDFELEITYCPIIKEISSRHIVDIPERHGLHWEKRMNASDRLVSYEDLEDVQRKELYQKGNSKIFYEENYPSFDMSVKVNSIVNNNYYVVSKRMTIDNKVTNVEYTLTKDYPFKNEDVGLGIEYERYLIPYEFVMRDIYLENHLLFSTRSINTDPKYFSEELGCTQEFLEDIFINGIGTFLYSQMKFDYDNEDSRKILMRLAKLESKFTMILTGKFPDNYSAGTQRFGGYIGNDPELAGEFSQPYRYTDYRGRVKSISEFAIGYSDDSGEVSKKKLVVKKNGTTDEDYPLNRFPQVEWEDGVDDYEVVKPNTYIDLEENVLLEKDERESIQLNFHTFLESIDQNIKWYSFKPITDVAIITNDFELTDSLTLQEVLENCEIVTDEVYSITITRPTVSGLYGSRFVLNVKFDTLQASEFQQGIVLLNRTGNNYTLCGVAKNVSIGYDSGRVSALINIYTVRYGKKA